MAAGQQHRIELDPPGSIGIIERDAVFVIRFEERDDDTRPQDDGRVCNDFEPADGMEMPVVSLGVMGLARSFDGLESSLVSSDIDPGATLLTRDCTIQVILSWGANQDDGNGTIISRGLGDGTAEERVSYRLQLDTVDLANPATGRLRWYWEGTDGTGYLQDGPLVTLAAGQFTMLTATRRWISPEQVELCYYVGDEILGQYTSTDGDIGGSILGSMAIGAAAGSSSGPLNAVVDEIVVVGRELCAEEVEATWLRITKWQPFGVRLLYEMVDQGFPLPGDRDSDPSLEMRMDGTALGFVAASIENMRANFLPERAYGHVLEQWEEATRPTASPVSSIQERRARVIARLSQRRGSAIPGIRDALRELIDTDPENLEFIGFSNLIVDDFSTIDPLRWFLQPPTAATASGGSAVMASAAADLQMLGTVRNWRTMAMAVAQRPAPGPLGNGGEHALVKLSVVTPTNRLEAGLFFGDRSIGNYILLGIRDTSGTYSVMRETFVNRVSQGEELVSILPGNPAELWLYLHQQGSQWVAGVSVTGPDDLQISAPFSSPTYAPWGGLYIRSVGGSLAGSASVSFDSYTLFTPQGSRPFNAYVLREESLGGNPDMKGANATLQGVRHSYIKAAVIESRITRYDAEATPHDRGPMGAL